jgi:hypothetical protein
VNGWCECGTCGRKFTGLTAFDKHRRNFGCVNPATVGLEQKPSGMWGEPASAASRERVRILRASEAETHTPGTPQAPKPAKSRTGPSGE